MLGIALHINDKLLCWLEVRRIEPRTLPENDTICLYYIFDDEGNKIGEITHRYGDKAERLAAKVLELLAPPKDH